MDNERRLEDFTEEEIKELEQAEAEGTQFLTVESISNLMNFTDEELAEIEADADEAYAEIEAEFDAQQGGEQ